MDKTKARYAYFKDKIVRVEEANINIQTHALQYGTACFGGIRGYWDDLTNSMYLFRLEDHYRRLLESSKILLMRSKYSIAELMEITLKLVSKNADKNGIYIRPFLYKSDLSLSPRLHNVKNSLAIYIIPLENYLDIEFGLKCRISSWRRITDNMIPTKAKASGVYINSALAKSEAMLDNYDEAIFLDHMGYVSEGSAANIFIVKNDKLITPPLSASILDGITRKTIIELAREELKLEVIQRNIERSELYIADEVFFCGTGVQVAWIKEIDRRIIGSGEIGKLTKQIQRIYFEVVKGRLEKYSKWLTKV